MRDLLAGEGAGQPDEALPGDVGEHYGGFA